MASAPWFEFIAFVEVRGLEPLASAVRRPRSSRLSYTPETTPSLRPVPRRERPDSAGPKAYSPPEPSSLRWRASREAATSCWIAVIVRSERLRSTALRAASVRDRRPLVIESG